jgi:hypothetical protein
MQAHASALLDIGKESAMTKKIAKALSIEVKVLNAYTTKCVGKGVDKSGEIHAKPGASLPFWSKRPFALFIKDSNNQNAPSPFEDDELMYGSKWNQGGHRYEITPPVKLKDKLVRGNWYDYGVAVLNTDGTLQVLDPRIIID